MTARTREKRRRRKALVRWRRERFRREFGRVFHALAKRHYGPVIGACFGIDTSTSLLSTTAAPLRLTAESALLGWRR